MQDKEKVLSDVRSIISEQLGTEVEKVRPLTSDCSTCSVIGVDCDGRFAAWQLVHLGGHWSILAMHVAALICKSIQMQRRSGGVSWVLPSKEILSCDCCVRRLPPTASSSTWARTPWTP
jgi:hypothetical protein